KRGPVYEEWKILCTSRRSILRCMWVFIKKTLINMQRHRIQRETSSLEIKLPPADLSPSQSFYQEQATIDAISPFGSLPSISSPTKLATRNIVLPPGPAEFVPPAELSRLSMTVSLLLSVPRCPYLFL
ncbi:MAG: hypothetical protein P4M11_08760, partial [Candidatus Pacebacteria bacterium]|nr:hypothetical protein [Candidatus Paceibacterota bacterium]